MSMYCKNPIKRYMCEKDYILNPSTFACETDKYLKILLVIQQSI